MIYQDYKDKTISALGFGCMRLPIIDGDDAKVDAAAAEKMVAYAMDHGINYYDTAWGYHGGNSELVMGEALSKYPREKFFLADKFPGYDAATWDKVEEIFEEQLKKCKVDYFDFYLFHNVCEMNIDAYLDPKYGIFDYLMKQKENGLIRHLGFSAHGSLETMERFLEAYGQFMEFGQLQLNWLDWEFQNGKEKVELLARYGIPVWVMEPVRGGSLLKLGERHENMLKERHSDWTLADWAFRFLQGIPGVTVTLSGMSDDKQLAENIATYEKEQPLIEEDLAVLMQIAEEKTTVNTVPCTACHYCTSHCPQELDIPWLLELYNEHVFSDGGFIAPMALGALPENKQPSACIGCRSCEAVCPQQIKISEALADFTEKLKG